MFGRILNNRRIISKSLIAVSAISAATTLISSPSECQWKSKKYDLKDKVVMITGASAGIGESCSWAFAAEGAKLVLIGRRNDRLIELKKKIEKDYPMIKILTIAMSVTDLDAVAKLPSELPSEFANVSVLVNNAGLALGLAGVDTNSLIDAQKMMDTNVLSIIAMCTAFAPGMKERGDGHIINMGSIAGHYAYSSGTMYCASKYAVRGFTEAARHDLVGTPVRMTHISPGMVGNTEFSNVRFNQDNVRAASVYNNLVALHPDDIADNVVYAATRPAHVQIAELMVYPTNQSGPQNIARVGENLGGKTVKQ